MRNILKRATAKATTAVGLTSLAAVMLVSAQPAEAATSYGLKNRATLDCLDSNSSGSVYATRGPCSSSNNFQQWTTQSGSYATLRKNVATNRCLDANASGRVYTNRCSAGNSYQNWIAQNRKWTPAWGIYTYQYKNVATGECLDTNTAGSIYTNPCGSTANNHQQWGKS